MKNSIKLCDEAASADIAAAVAFPKEFQGYVEQGNYSPYVIFNIHETGLDWKKLPTLTFVSRKECSAPAFKVAKDGSTILLGANV